MMDLSLVILKLIHLPTTHFLPASSTSYFKSLRCLKLTWLMYWRWRDQKRYYLHDGECELELVCCLSFLVNVSDAFLKSSAAREAYGEIVLISSIASITSS